jgi:Ca-activated chloride channel family protein
MVEQFHFLHPMWLVALIPLALMLWLLSRQGNGAGAWRRVVDSHLLPHLLIDRGGRVRRFPLAMLAIGWLVGVLALADPTWARRPLPVFRTQEARVIVLDLSRSMNTPDLKPSRLARARYKVEDILERSKEGQTGLVAFAGDAFVVSPLTDDARTVQSLLQALDTRIMPVQGSRADLGLQAAAKLLRQAGLGKGEILLVTDDAGDDRTLAVARELSRNHYTVSVLGVGTEAGAPLSGEGGGFVRDAKGQVVVPRLDSRRLRALATAGGGRFAVISADSSDLDTLIRQPVSPLNASLAKARLKTETWQERGPWLVLLLLPLAALAFRRGWLLAVAFVLVGSVGVSDPAMALSWDDLWQRRDQQAAQALAAGDNRRAAEIATDPAQLGTARFRQGDFAQALDLFSASTGPDAHYNRGNTLARLGRYQDAIAAYDQALKEQPGMEDAKYNKALVEALLRKQQQRSQAAGRQQAQESQRNGERGQGQQSNEGQERSQSRQKQPAQGGQGQGQAAQPRAGDGAHQGQPAAQSTGARNGPAQQRPQSAQGSQMQGPRDAGHKPDASAKSASERQGAQQASKDTAGEDVNAGAGDGQDQPPERQGMNGYTANEQLRANARQAQARDQQAEPDAPGDNERDRTGAGRQRVDGDASGPGGEGVSSTAEAEPLTAEERQAIEQWLRRIPDDPGGLLRRKFLYQYRQRAASAELRATQPW